MQCLMATKTQKSTKNQRPKR